MKKDQPQHIKPTADSPLRCKEYGKLSQSSDALAEEVANLKSELSKLTNHRFMKIQNSFWRLLLYQITNGLVLGLGTVLGATILVSILVYFLSQIELLPIIGEWATQIMEQIELKRR